MKSKILNFFILILSLSLIFSFKCGHEKIKIKPKILNNSYIKDNKTRRLDSYHPISFFVDYTQMDKYENKEYINFLKSSIDDTLKLFHELIKVKRTRKIRINDPKVCTESITDYNKIITTTGVDYDIILIPIIDRTLDIGIDAAAAACYIDENDKRPIMGFVLLNQYYSYNKINAKDYLIMLLLHEITHILVFSDSLFQYYQYSGDITTTKMVNGVKRTLLITSTVRNVAAEHFGCSSLTGIELENQGGEGSIGCHWEARVMLGDYMISTDYPEIVISDITLALFKDSGWYEVNYYSGGLFRFGKGQGCKFLDSFCVTLGKSNFEWEFCNEKYENICSSNNLNRGICYKKNYPSRIPSYFQYFGNSFTGGWEPADYCPVAIEYSSSSYYFQMSCVYGEETKYPSSLGFSISNNSICMKSSLVNASDSSLTIYNYQRSMCHKIKCNLKSKTYDVDIGQTIIKCPTEGGVFEVEGYNGTITCPPFDRVCTSEIYIGNPIQAVLDHINKVDLNNIKINNLSDSDDESYNNIDSYDSVYNIDSFDSIYYIESNDFIDSYEFINSYDSSLDFISTNDSGSFYIFDDSSSSSLKDDNNNFNNNESKLNIFNKYSFFLLILWLLVL